MSWIPEPASRAAIAESISDARLALTKGDLNLAISHVSAAAQHDKTHSLVIETARAIMNELIRPQYEPDINPTKAHATLGRYGLKIEENNLGIWVATNVLSLNKLMSTSVYAEGWQKVLQRNPSCKKGDKSMRFGGEVSRALFIPMVHWPIHEKANEDGKE